MIFPPCFRCKAQPCACADGVTLYHGDARRLLPLLSGVYAVVTDPPYGLNYQPDGGHRIAGDQLTSFRRLLLALPELLCDLAPTTLGWFARWDTWHELVDALGRYFPPTSMVVWDKLVHGRGNCRHFGPRHELVYVHAPAAHLMRVAGRRPQDVFACRKRLGNTFHITEKPVALMAHLVESLCPAGAAVLDPFCGSGSTLLAARQLGRRAIGIELDETHCHTAARRLAEERAT